MHQEFAKRGIALPTVGVCIMDFEGKPVESLIADKATQTPLLMDLLRRTITRLELARGTPVIAPKPQSAAPPGGSGDLVIHVVARGYRQGSWREVPAENWLRFSPAEWKKFLPAEEAAVGKRWEMDAAVSRKILTTFYPQTEDPERADRNQFVQQALRLEVIAVTPDLATARIDGELLMGRSFYPGRPGTEQMIRARLLGYATFHPKQGTIRSLQLVTHQAFYADEEFGAAATAQMNP
jgi:hypothetical protein